MPEYTQAGHCHFSPRIRRRANKSTTSPESAQIPRVIQTSASPSPLPSSELQDTSRDHLPSGTPARSAADCDASVEEEADVHREARLLCDAQGELIFIGDCAPLSLFQTVRQIVTSRVDPDVFARQTSRVLMLENTSSGIQPSIAHGNPPVVNLDAIGGLVSTFAAVTSGLVDLIDCGRFANDLAIWAGRSQKPDDVASAVNYLVLAIGSQTDAQDLAAEYFHYAKTLALASLDGNLGVDTVKAFAFITFVSQGRPPAMSDVDCTVPYRITDDGGQEVFELLNASVQIFLITERIVLEVYSRRKITLQLTEGISRQLRDWSAKWLCALRRIVSVNSISEDRPTVVGACQVLSSYYYAVILVSRPFLIFADRPPRSWLFASALVIGVGLLGGFGRVLEKYARMAISALEFFAKEDTHAMQYSLIAKSLLTSALQYLETKETKERIQIAENSSQLFGLIPKEDALSQVSVPVGTTRDLRPSTTRPGEVGSTCISPASRAADSMFGEIDTSIFSLNDPLAPPSEFSHLARNPQDQVDQVFGALNLFPLLNGNGHIDLAHYL
ncbi:hypothetical protein DL767_001717 [Monosporascus sp. MG133]|nr:hypothetical protein DL767_001717 [Monosporascus sp. MG133]